MGGTGATPVCGFDLKLLHSGPWVGGDPLISNGVYLPSRPVSAQPCMRAIGFYPQLLEKDLLHDRDRRRKNCP